MESSGLFRWLDAGVPAEKGARRPLFRWLVGILLLFLAGTVMGSFLTIFINYGLKSSLPHERILEIAMAVSYPVMFIPLLIWSLRRKVEGEVMPIDSKLRSGSWVVLALACAVGTVCLGYAADGLMSLLPEPSEAIKAAMEALTTGNFWINFLCVSIMAPIFEECMCRGVILRGLLHGGLSAWAAVVISALCFALIHGNMWQAVPAFILGVFMGFVYVKTGSLKLTILIHFVNNTTSLLLSRIPSLQEVESWMDLMPSAALYWGCFAVAIVVVGVCVLAIRRYQAE